MKIFVISLKSSKRRTFVSKQMEEFGLDFDFFDAINGKELSEEEIEKNCDIEAIKKHPKWLNKGALGCALSHLYIYQEMIQQSIERAIILEDDMVLNKEFRCLLNKLNTRKEKEEVIMLYYRAFNKVTFSTKDSTNLNDNFKILKPYTLDDIPITTGCYYITKNACKKLSDIIQPIRVSADSWKYFVKNSEFKNINVVYPRPLNDFGFKSDIDYHETNSGIIKRKLKIFIDQVDNPFFNHLTFYLRKKRESRMSKFSTTNKKSII